MTEGALSLADGALRTARPDSSEDDRLSEARPSLDRHLTDIRGCLLDGGRIGLHLRQPVPEPRQTSRHEEHEAADLEEDPHALEIHGHHEAGNRKHDERNRQEPRLARDAGALIVEVHGVVGDRDEEHRVTEKPDHALEYELALTRIDLPAELEVQHQDDDHTTHRTTQVESLQHQRASP